MRQAILFDEPVDGRQNVLVSRDVGKVLWAVFLDPGSPSLDVLAAWSPRMRYLPRKTVFSFDWEVGDYPFAFGIGVVGAELEGLFPRRQGVEVHVIVEIGHDGQESGFVYNLVLAMPPAAPNMREASCAALRIPGLLFE